MMRRNLSAAVRPMAIVTASILALSLTACGSDADADGSNGDSVLTLVNAGGDSEMSIKEAYAAPFTEATGTAVRFENPQNLGKIQAMVNSGKITANLFELTGSEYAIAAAEGLLEPLDWSAIDPEPMLETAEEEFGLGFQYYSTIMAWAADAKAPTNWEDFWDTDGFPGRRAIPDFPSYVLPFALIADGVDPENLYPLDLDRAFESLDKIKDHVIFWDSGSQSAQLLIDGEAAYAIGWSGRFVEVGDAIQYSFNEGMFDTSYLTIPKGASNVADSYKFLHQVTIPQNQVKATEVIRYSGPSPELGELVSSEVAAKLPTTKANLDVQFRQDIRWWGENGADVAKRWLAWKQGS